MFWVVQLGDCPEVGMPMAAFLDEMSRVGRVKDSFLHILMIFVCFPEMFLDLISGKLLAFRSVEWIWIRFQILTMGM